MVAHGFDLVANSMEDYEIRIRTDIAKWAGVIQSANLKTE